MTVCCKETKHIGYDRQTATQTGAQTVEGLLIYLFEMDMSNRTPCNTGKKSFELQLIAVLTLVRSLHPLNYDCAVSLEFLSDIFHKDAAQRRSRKKRAGGGEI